MTADPVKSLRQRLAVQPLLRVACGTPLSRPRPMTTGMTLIVLAALSAAAPLAAQTLDTSPELEELIPDEALDDPDAWAAQGVDGAAQVDPALLDELAEDPATTAEMAALERELDASMAAADPADPLLALDDPADLVLPEIVPLEPGEPVEFVTFDEVIPPLPEGSEVRVSDELVLVFPTDTTLFPVRDEFIDRFSKLSAVEDLSDDGSQAQLAAQARADEELLQRMLRVYGYFDAQVIRSVVAPEDREDGAEGQAMARFDVIPGRRYTVGAVDLGMLEQAQPMDREAVTTAYGMAPGDLLSVDAIAEGRDLRVTTPPNPMLSWIGFSPDGKRFAFTQQRDNGIELWIGDSATGQARSITPAPASASRLPVGSSANSSFGRTEKARASATRCCSPPDRCFG